MLNSKYSDVAIEQGAEFDLNVMQIQRNTKCSRHSLYVGSKDHLSIWSTESSSKPCLLKLKGYDEDSPLLND
jgi:hypothetical protein